jgi:hypothetical protein
LGYGIAWEHGDFNYFSTAAGERTIYFTFAEKA